MSDITEIAQEKYLTRSQFREAFGEEGPRPDAGEMVMVLEVLTPTKRGEICHAIYLESQTNLTSRGWRLPDGRWIERTCRADPT